MPNSNSKFYFSYLTRNPDYKPFLPAEWKFFPFENHAQKATSQQQHQAVAVKSAKSLAAANPSTTPIVIED